MPLPRRFQRCALLAAVATAASCGGEPATTEERGIPPPPPTLGRDLGPDQPPVVWIGGSLSEVSAVAVVIRESSGSLVRLERLGSGATGFFEISGGRWDRLEEGATVRTGGEACVEALMDEEVLLALRVFLGARCGPA